MFITVTMIYCVPTIYMKTMMSRTKIEIANVQYIPTTLKSFTRFKFTKQS